MICLHHNDADGYCAGAIVRYCSGDELALYEVDYVSPIPWDKINAARTVIMVDFSLPRAEMQKIYRDKGKNFIWIDHHISAIEEMSDLSEITGLRAVDRAACVLTWEYFFPDYEIPAAVYFIGDRDTWQFNYPQTRAFNEGLMLSDDLSPYNDYLWPRLFNNDESLIQEFIDKGEILLEATSKQIARQVAGRGFETTFGGYRTLAINLPSNGDIGHHICSLGYDLAYVYSDIRRNNRISTSVTLYSDTVDVSVLAKAFGGGGHRGAAGFSFIRAGNSPFPSETDRTG